MSYFKQASRQRLRFNTSQGNLSVEQLWTLSLSSLAKVIKELNSQLKKDNDSDELSFLDSSATPVNKTLELKFNLAKEVYLELKTERDAEQNKAEVKAHNAKIEAIIAEKEEVELLEKTPEELRKMLKD